MRLKADPPVAAERSRVTTPTLPVICLTGSTATGKTDLAITLAKHLPIDLISVDSGQVYRGMNIGTAKPESSTLQKFPHGLVDVRDIDHPYSAAEFRRDAEGLIRRSLSKRRIPLLVGGTLFYFSALLDGLPDLPEADIRLRAALEEEASTKGWPTMYRKLQKLDPCAARRIDPNDRQRVLRALEINLLSGKTIETGESANGLTARGIPVLKLALFISDRAALHQRISERLDQMLQGGFVEEVNILKEQFPGTRQTPAMRSVGYQQIWSYLDQEMSYAEMVENVRTATRRLAKRQLTWLRNEPGCVWFDTLNPRLTEGILGYLAGSGVPVAGRQG